MKNGTTNTIRSKFVKAVNSPAGLALKEISERGMIDPMIGRALAMRKEDYRK